MNVIKFLSITAIIVFISTFNLKCIEDDIFNIENDTIRQNENIKLKINKKDFKEYDNLNDLYVAFLFYIKTDNRFINFEIKKNDSMDNEYIYFSKKVPKDASVCIIDINHKDQKFSLFSTDNLIIYKEDNNYSEGALNAKIMHYADSSNYLYYFNLDRKLYPQNFNIFASKWLFELNNQLFSINKVEKDLITIQNSNYTTEQKNILTFVGKSFKNKALDSINFQNILEMKNSNNLNYEILVILIDQVLGNLLEKNDLKNTISRISLNNPDSKYTHIKIISGEILSCISKDSLLTILELLYNNYKNDPQWMIKYAYTIAKNNPEKSIAISQEIIDRLKTNDMTKHLSMDNNILKHKGTVVAAINESTTSLKQYKKGLSMIKEFDKYYDITDKNSTSYYYYAQAQLFENISLDSALYYYTRAYKFSPQLKRISNALTNFAVEKLNIQITEQTLDSLCNLFDISTSTAIDINVPKIYLSDDSSIDIKSYDKPILIFNSFIGCKPCEMELDSIFSINFDVKKMPLILFTDIKHYKFKKKKKQIPMHLNVKGIKNGVEINKVFNLKAAPNAVLIENNKIVLRISGYNPNDKKLIEKALK